MQFTTKAEVAFTLAAAAQPNKKEFIPWKHVVNFILLWCLKVLQFLYYIHFKHFIIFRLKYVIRKDNNIYMSDVPLKIQNF